MNVLSGLSQEENIWFLGHKKDEVFQSSWRKLWVLFLQTEQLGTGHAVIQAKEKLQSDMMREQWYYMNTPTQNLINLYQYHKKVSNITTIPTSICEENHLGMENSKRWSL